MPEISPPPPTLASTVVTPGACAASSSPVVPAPSTVSGWSKACTGRAPLPAAHCSLAASASA